MSQKQMLENEVFEEILRERTSYYYAKNKKIDFWMLIAPNFLKFYNYFEKIKTTKFYNQHQKDISFDFNKDKFETLLNFNKEKQEFYSVIISSDKEFIKWLKLRVGYFEDLNNLNKNNEEYVSDGVYGTLVYDRAETLPLLSYNKNFLHPEILLKKYKKALEISYINP
jgi:hypothetical protein